MKHLLQSCLIAFSMYSRLPVPTITWSQNNMLYALCFFPFVGLVIAVALYGWFILAAHYPINNILTAAVATILPILLTGGIHLDGFCDTFDALASNASPERKQEILKDPHIGAFALVATVLYLLLTFALWTQYTFDFPSCAIIGLGYFLARALSGFSLVSSKKARKDGLVATFASMADQKTVMNTLLLFILLCSALILHINLVLGSIVLFAAALAYLYYLHTAYDKFSGISGDLAGFFVQQCEIFILISVIVYQLSRQ